MHARSPILLVLLLLVCSWAAAADKATDYRLGPGDAIRILVFQNPEMTVETRVAESGAVTYPLIGTVRLGGLTLEAAEQEVARQLKEGGFVQRPQVTVMLLANRGNQVSVLGQVNRPGRFPLDNFNMRLTDMIAQAGGVSSTGADTVVVVGTRNGKPMHREIDLPALFFSDTFADDITLAGGDVVYVQRAPVFYIYGEAQRPGAYRIERNMSVRQALAQGGGPTARGTENRIRLHRRKPDGSVEALAPEAADPVRPDDVIYVRESLF